MAPEMDGTLLRTVHCAVLPFESCLMPFSCQVREARKLEDEMQAEAGAHLVCKRKLAIHLLPAFGPATDV